MNLVLYDMCKDAITKSAAASDEDEKLLIDAAATALMLAAKARQEGLLALEKAAAAVPFAPDYLMQMVSLIVDGRDPEIVLEIAACGYWNQNPQGIHAMVRYFYIRSMLLMQMGENPHLIEELFASLIPGRWRDHLLEQAAQERERMEQERQEATADIFYNKIRPSFQNSELLKELDRLENDVQKFSAASLQTLLRHIGIEYALVVCLYAFQRETRQKILCNVSRWRSKTLMQEVIWRGRITEQEVLTAVQGVNSMISCLRESGEIAG